MSENAPTDRFSIDDLDRILGFDGPEVDSIENLIGYLDAAAVLAAFDPFRLRPALSEGAGSSESLPRSPAATMRADHPGTRTGAVEAPRSGLTRRPAKTGIEGGDAAGAARQSRPDGHPAPTDVRARHRLESRSRSPPRRVRNLRRCSRCTTGSTASSSTCRTGRRSAGRSRESTSSPRCGGSRARTSSGAGANSTSSGSTCPAPSRRHRCSCPGPAASASRHCSPGSSSRPPSRTTGPSSTSISTGRRSGRINRPRCCSPPSHSCGTTRCRSPDRRRNGHGDLLLDWSQRSCTVLRIIRSS